MNEEKRKDYRWDTDVPEDFKIWHKKNGQGGKPVAAWNSARDRQEFYKSRGVQVTVLKK